LPVRDARHLVRPHPTPAGPPRGAFSLIELLIAVAIIGLLVSIMAPSLHTAKALARLAACRSQLRQWGLGFATYAAENGGFYPHIDGLDRGKGPPDWCGWVDVLPPLMGEEPWRDHAVWHRPGQGTVFQCPAAELAPASAYAYQPRRDGYFSYAMNSCLELDEDCWRAPGDGGVAMPSFLDTSLIVSPDRVVLLFDQLLDPELGYGGQGPCATAGKYCGSYPKAFSARHASTGGRGGGAVLFCDYRVEWRATVWKPDWPADLEVPPRSDRDWFPYPPAAP
jgi:prepilin-type N-terminal cleavage/methylation domain-containing protein